MFLKSFLKKILGTKCKLFILITVHVTDSVFSSIANTANSPLLRLPGEIRNEIFAYLYTDAGYEIELDNDCADRRVVLSDVTASLRRYLIRLLLVCRQVHAETALLLYELGEFLFTAEDWGSHLAVVGMRSFLERLSPRQLHATGKMTLWRPGWNGRVFWVQTRTAADWLAKLDGMVFASGAEMYFGVPKYLDIADFGPSDN